MTNIARDIKFIFNPVTKGEFADVEIDSGDFVLDSGLETMILISLFSDSFVSKDSSFNGESRGWYGDSIVNFSMGSKIWQLDRAKTDNKTLVLMAQYAKDALSWMVDDGIILKVETYAQKATDRSNVINLFLAIYRPDGEVDGFKYRTQWESQIGN